MVDGSNWIVEPWFIIQINQIGGLTNQQHPTSGWFSMVQRSERLRQGPSIGSILKQELIKIQTKQLVNTQTQYLYVYEIYLHNVEI